MQTLILNKEIRVYNKNILNTNKRSTYNAFEENKATAIIPK